MFLYETHCHSSDCSLCGRSTAREMVRAYHRMGFAGMVLTDHFVTGNSAVDPSLSWEERMRRYYQAYADACDEAKDLDFDVIFGIEHAYGDGKEVLVYGIDLPFLLENPDLDRISLEEFGDRVRSAGGILIHAHPYRRRSYISNEAPPRLDLVDGIEVYNAGNGPCDGDRLALVIAGIVGCIQTAGSDLHNVSSAKLGQAGIVFNRRVRDSRDFVQALQQNVCGYMVGGDIVPQIHESNLM